MAIGLSSLVCNFHSPDSAALPTSEKYGAGMSIFDYCFSFSHPFSPSGIHHSDKIFLSSLRVFSPDFHLSLFAFSFVCGTKWAKVGPLSAVQGIDSVARLQSDLKTRCESRWLGRGVRKKSVPFHYQGSRWLLFNILLLLIVLSSSFV